MNNDLMAITDPIDSNQAGGLDFPIKQPEDYLEFAIGTTIHAVADIVKESSVIKAEADKHVLEALVCTEGESSSARSKAACDYRKESAKADAERLKQVGGTILKTLAGGAVVFGVVKLLGDTDII